ncbi:MAG: WYL domain-containing protein [Candidatus Delongbacteria bacterium]|nr:WYL domain-containing protein [Candidatus Delongbacteria bacterium]
MPSYIDRTLKILKLLSQEPYVTSQMVAEKLEVELRSAQRYLEEIACRSFIQCRKVGVQCQYSLINREFYIRDSILNESEISFINILLNLGIDEVKMDDHFLNQLKNKISYLNAIPYSLVSRYGRIDFDKLTRQRSEIETAIRKKKAIRFVYTRYEKPKPFTVHPYHMMFYNGFLMLMCQHNGILKKFAVDFMENVEIDKKTPYMPKDEEEIRDVLANTRTMWFQDVSEPVVVTVRFPRSYSKLLDMKECFPGQRIVSRDDSGYQVEFEAYNEQDCWDLLKWYFPHFTIIAPVNYRHFVIDQVSQFMANHQANDSLKT